MSLVFTGLAFPGLSVAGDNPLDRNRALEEAVVQHLHERGFGLTNRILTLDPHPRPSPDPSPSRGYDYRWPQSSRDRGAQQAIAAQLQETIPGGRDLYVLVQNGQAFLFGRVRNQQQRRHAEEIARNTESIGRVRNQLTVAEQGWLGQEDSQIEKAIRSEWSGNPFLQTGRIQVRVSQGVAVLSGNVDSFTELVVAVEGAFRGGARSVRNQMQIAAGPDRPGRDVDDGEPAIEPSRLR